MADTIKAKVKTSRMVMDINGGLDDALVDIFSMINDATRRENVLLALNAQHAEMIDWAANKGGANG